MEPVLNRSPSQLAEAYRFRPSDLMRAPRPPGISAFIRTRDGGAFLEAVIRSHIDHFDEIVVVHNQCTDETPAILARLQHEFGQRLPVFEYGPGVHPPGSVQHANEPADSPHSLVNYYNFSLARTRFAVALKLDDDHIANGPEVARVTRRIRTEGIPRSEVWCFSGINIARDPSGAIGVPGVAPLVGFGDHCFFRVDETTFFVRDPRFERFRAPGRRRIFTGVLYWHLKYLKPGHGFANYGIEAGDNQRYRRKRDRYLANRTVMSIAQLRAMAPAAQRALRFGLPTEKRRLKLGLWRAVAAGVVDDAALGDVVSFLGLSDRDAGTRADRPPARLATEPSA